MKEKSGNPSWHSLRHRAQPEITCTGSIEIGERLEIHQTVQMDRTEEEPSLLAKYYPTMRTSAATANAIGGPASGLKAPRVLENAPNPSKVSISGAGLTNGYGIFGAPGTGKTRLMIHLLRQLFSLSKDDPDSRFGALILDPKAAMLDHIVRIVPPHREDDLLILRPDLLPDNVNVIESSLVPSELGRILVLAARSAGVDASDPFWFQAWTNLFGAAITLLEYDYGRSVSIRELIDAILLPDLSPLAPPSIRMGRSGGFRNQPPRNIESLSSRFRDPSLIVKKCNLSRRDLRVVEQDISRAVAHVESFYQSDYVDTIESFITNAFGAFQEERLGCFSCAGAALKHKDAGNGPVNLYDAIIESGKIVVVSLSPSEPSAAKLLCTLVKCLFQQAVMSRRDRFLMEPKRIHNFKRPVLIACDEYAEVASEVPGSPVGDGRFFSLARENGCMGLLATQSVHVLENSSLKQSWKSVFSNFAGKIFMGAADNETAKQASDLAGTMEWLMSSSNVGSAAHGSSVNSQRDLKERPTLPTYLLTELGQRQGVVIGSLDGRATKPEAIFFQVPVLESREDGTKQ